MAKLSALSKATRTSTGPAKKADPKIVVAAEVRDFQDPNSVLYTQDQVIESIEGYAEGDRLKKQGEALMKLHRSPVETFGLHNYAQRWAALGNRPDNPKLVTKVDGTGTIVTYMVQDKEVKLDDNEFATLSNLVGAAQAEENVVKRDEIYFNQDKLNEEVPEAKGKSVVEIIDEAVSQAFAKLGREDVLEGLFEIKERFTTKKGLINKGVALVGTGKDSARKLAEFVEVSKAVVSLRPGSGGEK